MSVEENNEVDLLIDNLCNEINESISIENVISLDKIKDARDGYKKLKKDPSRTKVAVESLYRRIVKGNKLYRINNVVDIGNYLSLLLRRSTAVLDYNKISGDIIIKKGTEDTVYEGIGRGKINVSNIPIYVDNIGPFGSTTSDTNRTKITNETKQILLFVINFCNYDDFDEVTKIIEYNYVKYCKSNMIEKGIIKE